MYKVYKTKAFLKSSKKINASIGGKKIIKELSVLINILAKGNKLPANYRDHSLRGEYADHRECHLRADMLLVYKIEKGKMILILVEIGSHSYLF
jgi:mRNA interferase YafQ